MGLFSQLPEEPTEWAGLPSEPDRDESDAERLTDANAIDAAAGGILGRSDVTSVSIPLPAPADGESTHS